MHKFDVKYTLDDYYQYYKKQMIFDRLYTDLIFSAILIGYAIYYLIVQQDGKLILPIVSICLGVAFPLLKLVYMPVLKKQLSSKQEEIDSTHIKVTFNENDVLYENLTPKSMKENEENSFTLQYASFLKVVEMKTLFLFYINSKTTIIIPKSTYENAEDFTNFKEFIFSKVEPRRIKFKK